VSANICVLFTANDAYMRDFHLVIPADCVASSDADENQHALEHMRRVLKADTRPSTEIDFDELKRPEEEEEEEPNAQPQSQQFAKQD
jgi:nicotinamidase-related amidase